MKKLLLIFTLLFSPLMFSTPSYAEWKKVGNTVLGDIFYVDFERIRKHGGYVYWWTLTDYLEPTKLGNLSNKVYRQGDCKLFRHKNLSFSFHKEPMGGGIGDIREPSNQNWSYPPPTSGDEIILKRVCSQS